MKLQDYTTEELKAELKRRADFVKAEKAKVKRCRMCIHYGEVNYYGKPTEPTYRPFKSKEECWQEMIKHQPFGRVFFKK